MEESDFIASVMPHRHAMWTLALALGLDADEAEDAIQNTLIALWGRRQHLRAGPTLAAYCLTALHRTALRTLSGRKEYLDWELTETSIPTEEETEEHSEKLLRLTEKLLESLPAAQRDALTMHVYDGMTPRQIAAETDKTEANVRQLIHRARTKLKSLLKNRR